IELKPFSAARGSPIHRRGISPFFGGLGESRSSRGTLETKTAGDRAPNHGRRAGVVPVSLQVLRVGPGKFHRLRSLSSIAEEASDDERIGRSPQDRRESTAMTVPRNPLLHDLLDLVSCLLA